MFLYWRNPLLYPDFIFYLTPMGRKFAKNCNYVHSVAEDVIKKRKQTLVSDPMSYGHHCIRPWPNEY